MAVVGNWLNVDLGTLSVEEFRELVCEKSMDGSIVVIRSFFEINVRGIEKNCLMLGMVAVGSVDKEKALRRGLFKFAIYQYTLKLKM